jgi:hypothetical protein
MLAIITRSAPEKEVAMVAVNPSQDDAGRVDQPHLRKGVLSLFEVFAQSIADMGPSAAVGAISALVFATSAAGSWLVWALATVAGFVGAAALGYGIYVSFNPLVPFPGDIWLFIFCGILALACASYIWLKLAHRGVLQRIGSSATPPEVMTGHAAEPLIGRSASCER